jgi:hypothetical protein
LNDKFINGQFGVGKSYSILLYKVLSDYIYEYLKILAEEKEV